MSFVLDNSVAMAWCFEDEGNHYTEEVLEALKFEPALVPALWLLEASNVLAGAARRGRITAAHAHSLWSRLIDLPIVVAPDLASTDISRILVLAENHGLTTYDSTYVDLALRSGEPIATQDRAVIEAAQTLGVPLFGTQKSAP